MQKIIDSHVHFWNPEKLNYAWLSELPTLNRAFLPADLPQHGADWKLEKLVFVQADCLPEQGLAEANWISSLAQAGAPIGAIVAFAPLEKGEVVKLQLEQLQDFPLVKGIRRLIQSEGAGFCTTEAFINAVRLLPDFGYSFDICVKAHQLSDVLTLVKACPNVQFILDHCGKPDIQAGEFTLWGEQIKQLAAFPNLVCKLSGLVTEAHHQNWKASDLQPYIEHVLNSFGKERVLFGSDWPVLRLASTYETWIGLIMELVNSFSPDEHNALFYKNAERVYRL